jgi:hypothetical protein
LARYMCLISSIIPDNVTSDDFSIKQERNDLSGLYQRG